MNQKTGFSTKEARRIIEAFLEDLRQSISQRSLKETRLPPWIRAAKVRVGWVNDSLIFAFEDGSGGDTYKTLGSVKADTVVLLDTVDFKPTGASLRARDIEGLLIMVGQYQHTTLNLVSKRPALFDCGYAGYHGPRALINLVLKHFPQGPGEEPIITRFIPFALYTHKKNAFDRAQLWRLCEQPLMDLFVQIHNSADGDFYEQTFGPATIFSTSKKSSVIVLGKDSGEELQELRQVRDALRKKGYDAQLVKDLPEIIEMSNEEKVRLWTLTSRFCVMVDRVPAGHVAEFMMLREQRSILAVLRPSAIGSTYMIGDEAFVDINFIRLFEFKSTPLEVLTNVLDWAEQLAAQRTDAYQRAYPWRQKHR